MLRAFHASRDVWVPWDRAGQEHGGRLLGEQCLHIGGRLCCPRGHPHGDLPWPPSLLAALMSPRGPPGPPRWHSVPSGSPGTPAGLPADCRGRWESFVEETLTETNRRNAVDLVSRCGVAPEAPPVVSAPAWPGQVRGSRPPALLLQVSTHHLHPSSEDEDMEGVFPNELSLQQVCAARLSAPARPLLPHCRGVGLSTPQGPGHAPLRRRGRPTKAALCGGTLGDVGDCTLHKAVWRGPAWSGWGSLEAEGRL